MPEPIYTIIVPAYNRAGSLREALDSVLAQSCPDWECIIVDDGSTDGTPELAAGYVRRDPRFRYHRQENAGAVVARNAGIRLAQGSWIAFLDSDDKLLPWALGCYRHASRCLPGAGIVVGRIAYAHTPTRAPDVARLPVQIADYLPGSPGGAGHFFIHSVAVRADILQGMPCFDESLGTCEDSEFLLRLKAVGEAAVVAWPVAVLRQSAGGKYAHNIATGKRLDVELAMHRGYPEQSLVGARVADDAARDGAVRRYCALRVRVLEIARYLRDGRFADAAAAFTECWSGEESPEELRDHAARWFAHPFYPGNAPRQAAARFGLGMRGLARALRERGEPGGARFVEEFALASVLYESWRRVFHAWDLGGSLVFLTGLFHCFSPRAAAAVLHRRVAPRAHRARSARGGCRAVSPPTIAVIIPTHNRSAYLRQAIESVLGQTRPFDEIIVVDDGSTDDTTAVCASYPAVNYVRQSNQGRARACDVGLSETSATYIRFLDDDDMLLPSANESQLAALEKHPDAEIVYARSLRIDSNGQVIGEDLVNHKIPAKCAKALFRENFIRIQTVLLRRETLLAHGLFDAAMWPCDDYDLWLRLATRQAKLAYVPHPVAAYRIHRGSVSNQHVPMARTGLAAVEKNAPGLPPHWRAPAHYRLGRALLEAGELTGALAEFRVAVHLQPWSLRYCSYALLATHPAFAGRGLGLLQGGKRAAMRALVRAGLAEQRWGA